MSVRFLHEGPPGTCAAPPAFDAILEHLAAARSTIEIFMYVWRNDDIGNRLGQAVLDAAERGVRITIIKDTGAFLFERIEMNRKSFFNKPLPLATRLFHRLIASTFPDTFVRDDRTFDLGQRLLAHPNIEVRWINKTHTKYYIIDERILLTGSINIEDRHFQYHDYMALIDDANLVSHLRRRAAGEIPPAPDRSVEFLCNTHHEDGSSTFEIKSAILELINGAKTSIYVEMAYLGDEEISAALIAAANRGIDVTFLFSREANIGNDLNYRTIHRIFSAAPVAVHLTDTMIHAKLMMFDDATVITGSANLSIFSLQKAGELDLVIRDHPEALATLRDVIRRRLAGAVKVTSAAQLATYNRPLAALQQQHQKRNLT